MVTINNCSVNITINNSIQSKECSMCKTMKPLSEYNNHKGHSDGYSSSCRICTNSRNRDAYPKNEGKIREYRNKYRENNREKFNESRRNEYHTNEQYKLRMDLKNRLNAALKRNSSTAPIPEVIGCSLSFFKQWLAHQFTNEMSFENYGSYWEVEHLIPCSAFDLTKEEEQKRCFNWQNTQPMTKSDNCKKGVKRDIELEMQHALKVRKFKELMNTSLL